MEKKRACPYDNAVMENSFSTFKTECLYRCNPTTGEQVQQLVDEYIYFYGKFIVGLQSQIKKQL